MRGIPSLITDIRKKVFAEVTRMAYSGDFGQMEDIPYRSAPFLPLLFRQDGKEGAAGGASETTTTERILAGKASYPLCSFLPFQTAN